MLARFPRLFPVAAATALLLVFLPPSAALADDSGLAAGFAPGPLWLSKNAPVEGETVHIYTVVYDSSPTPIEGSVTFLVDGTSIGSSPFTLEAGATSVKSVDWVAREGGHSVSASVASAVNKSSKEPAVLTNASTTIVAITVSPAPPKPAALQAIDTASSALVSAAPIAMNAAQGLLGATENLRKSGEEFLESKLPGSGSVDETDASTTAPGQVLGVETYRAPPAATSADSGTSNRRGGIWQTIAKVLLPVFRYPALFYPFFAILLLIILWIVSKALRNPKR